MSTKVTIKSRLPAAGQPGFHLYDDVLDDFGDKGEEEPPVHLRLEGVAVELQTLDGGGATVTIALPRELARELGLLPSDTGSVKTETSHAPP